MKTEKEFRKEVDKILGEKVSAAVKAFQAQRDEDFKELMTLNQALETLEGKKGTALDETKGLNLIRNGDLAKSNQLGTKLRWLDGQIKGYKDQIEKVTQKLTEMEVDPKTLNFFLNFKS